MIYKSISVFWIKVENSSVEEINYSISICLERSKELCNSESNTLHWVLFEDEEELYSLVESCETEYCLIVQDPEIILNPTAINALEEKLNEDKADIVGPVYNLSSLHKQNAKITIRYLNISTYSEIAGHQRKKFKNRIDMVDELDLGCYLAKTESLRILFDKNERVYLQNITDNSIKKVVASDALIHRFGNYYHGERPDLESLIPENTNSILDIGTAFGGYAKGLKKRQENIRITGIEMNDEMAFEAKQYYDDFYIGRFEDYKSNKNFDLINCGDIIEHLYNPWKAFEKINELLKVGGSLILSIPNVGHWTVIADLLKGKFEYLPAGIQCVTHIRWFTEETIKKALLASGFRIDIINRQQFEPTEIGKKFIRKMVKSKFGDEQSLRTNEFIIRAIKQTSKV